MIPNFQRPKQALNKAFLKVKPNRKAIGGFKANLIKLIVRSIEGKFQKFYKTLVLAQTHYNPNDYVNIKGKDDLIIYNVPITKVAIKLTVQSISTLFRLNEGDMEGGKAG